ncbi:cystin-1 isoform X3 [Alligator mississippiensis]|uniref:cystin-1 isoform X3 n=1 Tax=Alligator mississippiensis TaxID=8496 RepID=UPI0028779324|nr:cystin-1 isoform X3 [Alligator mississippiensis]
MGSGSSRRRSRGGAPGSPGRAGGSPAAAGAGGGSPGAQDSAAEDADWRLLQEVLAECEEAAAPAPPAAQPALTRSTPDREKSNFTNECPVQHNKKPEGQSTISYDYSEEELMASIEREYCR